MTAWAAEQAYNDPCKDVVKPGETLWLMRPAYDGMAFWPSLQYADYACSTFLLIDYDHLIPLMNDTGKAAVGTLQSEIARRLQ